MEKQNGGRKTHFTTSAASSRSSSPAPSLHDYDSDDSFAPKSEHYDCQHSTDVYDVTLPRWRAAVRRKIVKRVELESKVVAKLQQLVRTPWLDLYFVYSSLLGSHTFFMVMLPGFAFFGRVDLARALIYVLAAGVYLSSVLKDLFCAPRPFAPPVVRLTISSFHLEYGFPSTHSTNGISMALFFFTIAHQLSTASLITPEALYIISGLLIFYTFSIVFGRIYTGMHSFLDCVMGSILGTGIWWGHSSWAGHPVLLSASNPLTAVLRSVGIGKLFSATEYVVHVGKGLGSGAWIEEWARTGGWEVPLILIPLCLLAVNQHPQPVDDCPCFEDAIAFGAVVLGAIVGLWGMTKVGAGVGSGLAEASIMPGSGWVRDAAGHWVQVDRTWVDISVWWGVAVLKMGVGILAIFIWRIVAKSALHLILPPTFRSLAKVFQLPNRRFYTPATEYKNVPSEFQVMEDGSIELHAIPSVIDLPSSAGFMVETGGIGSGVSGSSRRSKFGEEGETKLRSVNGSGVDTKKRPAKEEGEAHSVRFGASVKDDDEEADKDAKDKVKHYDAEVLTKVIVYAGIAFMACEVMPWLFVTVGWGLHSSP